GGGRALDHVRGAALHAERGARARLAGTDVVAHAGEHVPPARDGARGLQLDVRCGGASAGAFAAAAQPQAVDVATGRSTSVPRGAVLDVVIPDIQSLHG